MSAYPTLSFAPVEWFDRTMISVVFHGNRLAGDWKHISIAELRSALERGAQVLAQAEAIETARTAPRPTHAEQFATIEEDVFDEPDRASRAWRGTASGWRVSSVCHAIDARRGDCDGCAMTDQAHNCIIAMQDDSYVVAGPFASTDELIAWGERWQAEHGDDPRWQSIYLADPDAMPVRVQP